MSESTSAAFISYCRDDQDFALRLAQDLKAAGASVWLDQLDIKPGSSWDNVIEDALEAARQMLVILTPSSVKSPNVRNEITRALNLGIVVIPVLWMDCKIPLNLERTQRVDFRADYARGLDKLLRELRVAEPDQAVLDKAVQGDTQRKLAWQAREAEAERRRYEKEQTVRSASETATRQRDEAVRTVNPADEVPSLKEDRSKPKGRSLVGSISLAAGGLLLLALLIFQVFARKPTRTSASLPIPTDPQPAAATAPPTCPPPSIAEITASIGASGSSNSMAVKVPGSVMEDTIVCKVLPQYPAVARAAQVQGSVVIHALIGPAGTVDEAEVISGPEMLRESAVNAVKTWRYKPYTVKGEPVKVETTIEVDFTSGTN